MPSFLENRSRHVAFLAYHSIAPEGPAWLTVPPDRFERQLAALERWGWRTGGHAELAAAAAGGRPDRPTAFLTFDDGYADNHDHALPLLRAYGAKAIVYVLPPKVDDGGALDWPEVAEHAVRFPDVMRSLTWPQVEAMADDGVEFGSHSMTHPHLDRLAPGPLHDELARSREALRERLGACDSIAYPFGDWSSAVARAAAAAGYGFAFTVPDAPQDGATPLSVPRVSIDRRDDERRLRLKLSAAGRRVLLGRGKEHVRRLSRLARRG